MRKLGNEAGRSPGKIDLAENVTREEWLINKAGMGMRPGIVLVYVLRRGGC